MDGSTLLMNEKLNRLEVELRVGRRRPTSEFCQSLDAGLWTYFKSAAMSFIVSEN